MFNSISIKFQITIISFIRAMFGLVEENRDKLEIGATTEIVAWLQECMDVPMGHPERIGLIGDLVGVIVDRLLNPKNIKTLIENIPKGLTKITLHCDVEWQDEEVEVIFKAKQVGCPTVITGLEAEVAEEDIINLLNKMTKVAGPLPAPFRNTVADIYLTRALKKIGAEDVSIDIR
jgi:hypothetical protein